MKVVKRYGVKLVTPHKKRIRAKREKLRSEEKE